jgi:hypothetical protein
MQRLHFEKPFMKLMHRDWARKAQKGGVDKRVHHLCVSNKIFEANGSKVFHLTPSLAKALRDTDLDVPAGCFHAPYESQYFVLRDSNIPGPSQQEVADPNGPNGRTFLSRACSCPLLVEGAYLSHIDRHKVEEHLTVEELGDDEGLMVLVVVMRHTDKDAHTDELSFATWSSFISWKAADDRINPTDLMSHQSWHEEERRIFTGIWNTVIGACLYLSDPASPPPRLETPKKRKKSKRHSSTPRMIMGEGFIYAPGGGTSMREAGDPTGRHHRLHWVRGHWRQQWVGSIRARTRKQIARWIEPHKRGQGPTEILNKEYVVKENHDGKKSTG